MATKTKAAKAKKAARRISPLVGKTAKTLMHPAFLREKVPSIRELADRFGVGQETLSRMTGFSPRAVAEWARGKVPSAPVKRAFTEMDRLLDALAGLMQPKEVGRWLKEPNPPKEEYTKPHVIEREKT